MSGTENYRVQLWPDDEEIGFSCTCPLGLNEQFCKHCVADAIASDHPEQALPIYKKAVAPLIDQTSNTAYAEAINLLLKLRKVMSLLDRETDFDDYLIALRVDYKRKRNFIKLLDGLRK